MKNLLKSVSIESNCVNSIQWHILWTENFKIGLKKDPNSTLYSDLNHKIEARSKLLDLLLIKIGVSAFILPPVITTLTNFFVNHLGDESYEEFQLM